LWLNRLIFEIAIAIEIDIAIYRVCHSVGISKMIFLVINPETKPSQKNILLYLKNYTKIQGCFEVICQIEIVKNVRTLKALIVCSNFIKTRKYLKLKKNEYLKKHYSCILNNILFSNVVFTRKNEL